MSEMKKRGRPPKAPEDRRRHHQSFRTSEVLRFALQEAAAVNQRSMSEEAEQRIERSFELERAFGGPKSFRLLLNYARILQGIEETEGARWFDDSDEGHLVMARAAFAMKEAMVVETVWMKPVAKEDADKFLEAFNDLEDVKRSTSNSMKLTGQEEATRLMTSGKTEALPEHPASLFDKADFAEVWRDPPREDDGERGPHKSDPGEASPAGEQSAAVPAPRRGRRANVKT